MEIEPGSCLKEGVVDEFPTYNVDEIPYLEDLATTLEPQATVPEI
jgi:hypothetical protein